MCGEKERGVGGRGVDPGEPSAYLMGCLDHPKAFVSQRLKKFELK